MDLSAISSLIRKEPSSEYPTLPEPVGRAETCWSTLILPSISVHSILVDPQTAPLQGTKELSDVIREKPFRLSPEQKKVVVEQVVEAIRSEYEQSKKDTPEQRKARYGSPQEVENRLETIVDKYHSLLRDQAGIPLRATDFKEKIVEIQAAMFQAGYLFDLGRIGAPPGLPLPGKFTASVLLMKLSEGDEQRNMKVPAVGGMPAGEKAVFMVDRILSMHDFGFDESLLMGIHLTSTHAAHVTIRFTGTFPPFYDRLPLDAAQRKELNTNTSFEIRVNEAAHAHFQALYPKLMVEQNDRFGQELLVTRNGKSFTLIDCNELYSDLVSLKAATTADYTIGRKYLLACSKELPSQYGLSQQFFLESVHAIADRNGLPHGTREERERLTVRLFTDPTLRKAVNEHLLGEVDQFFREKVKPTLDALEGGKPRPAMAAEPAATPQTTLSSQVSTPSMLMKQSGITLTPAQRDRVGRELLPDLIQIDAAMRQLVAENSPPRGAGVTKEAAEAKVESALTKMETFFKELGAPRKEGISRYEYVTACMRSAGYLIDVSASEALIPGRDGKLSSSVVCQALIARLVDPPPWAIQTFRTPTVGSLPAQEYSPAFVRLVTTGWNLSPEEAERNAERKFPCYLIGPSPARGPVYWSAIEVDTVRAQTERLLRNSNLTRMEIDRLTGARGALEAQTCATFIAMVNQYPRVFQDVGQRGFTGGDNPLISVNDPTRPGKTVELSLNQAQYFTSVLYTIRSLQTDNNVPEVAGNFFGRFLWKIATQEGSPPSLDPLSGLIKAAWKKTQTDLGLPAETDDQIADRIYHNSDRAGAEFLKNLATLVAPFVEKEILSELERRERNLASRQK